MELLRVATAGSVDDGKSTLIGRLLLDSKQIFEDQLEAVERTSREKGFDYTNLALLTDGLRAEREQGITIDVAYRYFATPKRKFIIADTPGHVQYTRNMVTGASTADLAMILLDARKGVLEQSRRHAVIASLLQVRHLVLCVNKMDLVDFDEATFDRISDEFTDWAAKLAIPDLTFIPISALHGDNVTQHSPNTPWYGGPTLLHHLEHVYIGSDRNLIDSRFPVQWVVRPMSNEWHDYRGYAGEVAGGIFRPGDEVMVLPSGLTSTIESIDLYGTELEEAMPPQSVTIRLADNLDVSRGDMICRPNNAPTVTQEIDAMICWFSERPLQERGKYVLKHTTRTVKCLVRELHYRLEVNTLHRDESTGSLAMNDMGRVSLRITEPLFVDEYRRNRTTGSFILVDEGTNETVGAGMVLGSSAQQDAGLVEASQSPNVVFHAGDVTREERWAATGTQGATVWLTGLSGSGKSTIAAALERDLVARGIPAYMLDGDNLRHGLNGDLGFSDEDRAENVRRAGEVACLFADAGMIAIVPLISPYVADRDRVRARHAAGDLRFIEVYVDTPLELCEQRDPKGLYAKARAGELKHFTGIDDPYEAPVDPDLRIVPGPDPENAAASIVALLAD